MTPLKQSLYKVMKPEVYKGVPLINVLDRWVYGLKSFATKEELKQFIDKIYPDGK